MATGIPDYDEFRLRLTPGEGGAYRVHADGPDGRAASGTFSPPFDQTQLDNFVLRVGRPRRGVRALRSSQMEEAKRFGHELFESLLQGEVRDVYLSARLLAEDRGRGLRMTLSLTETPDLMQIPWEFLYERPSFLSQSIYSPLVRSLDLRSARPPRPLTLPLRILGMVSSPQDFEALDVDEERRKLDDALSDLIAQGMVELRWLERATLGELNRVIGAPDEVHVLHYIGHGTYDERTEGGILVLEDDRGRAHEVTGEELGSLLFDEHSLRLVVLNSCEGARSSHVDPFSGVASSLVEHQLRAVVGMQFEITDKAAITFADSLYTALAQGFPIDAALARARKAIWADGSDIEFGTPVLFLRTPDARLFEISGEGPRTGMADLSLQLEGRSTDAKPDDPLTWQLTIENTGDCDLSGVAATDTNGETLAAPVDLRPGQRNINPMGREPGNRATPPYHRHRHRPQRLAPIGPDHRSRACSASARAA